MSWILASSEDKGRTHILKSDSGMSLFFRWLLDLYMAISRPSGTDPSTASADSEVMDLHIVSQPLVRPHGDLVCPVEAVSTYCEADSSERTIANVPIRQVGGERGGVISPEVVQHGADLRLVA